MPGSDEALASLPADEAAFLEDAITQAIGGRLREERRRLGLTLQEVALRTGMSLGMISKIENAQTSPSLRTLARLSLALEVPVTTFFRGFEEERDASFVSVWLGNNDVLGYVVAGGESRHQSESHGLEALAGRIEAGFVDIVVIHDGARPFMTTDLLHATIEAARRSDPADPGTASRRQRFASPSPAATSPSAKANGSGQKAPTSTMRPASAMSLATSATRRMFSTRSASENPRSRLRP